jgi:hypothetical protein
MFVSFNVTNKYIYGIILFKLGKWSTPLFFSTMYTNLIG